VKQIVDAHGGYITVESTVGQGTTFRLFFPALTQSVAAKPEPKSSEEFRGNKELILVLEGELSLSHLIGVALESHDYTVLTARSAEEALAIYRIEHSRIRLLIADWNLPGTAGSELLRELRTGNPGLLTISMIASTTDNDTSIKGHITLYKPFSTEQLLRTVKEALANSVPPKSG